MRPSSPRLACCLALLLAHCTPGAPADAGPDAARADAAPDAARDAAPDVALCATDRDCADALFCNGTERCMPGAAGADALGCVRPAASPCAAGQTCNEAAARCEAACAAGADADGDGHLALACGGDDCDDADANRFPGNPEVCDGAHDEDCDAFTVGPRDADGDGSISAACCNLRKGAEPACGGDCDDAAAAVNRSAPEVCDGVDNNCNGTVDEGVQRSFYPDVDRDNYGARGAAAVMACNPPADSAENSLDCDDARVDVSPAQGEVCDGRDNNCNGAVDDGPTPSIACAATYGTPPNSPFVCAAGACSLGACVAPYGDCDGRVDDGCETDTSSDPNHCGACGARCGAGGVCTTTTGPGGLRAGACDRVERVRPGRGWICAQRSSGSVVCWGTNEDGQLGDGSLSDRARAVVVRDLPAAIDVGAQRLERGFRTGGEVDCGYTCARTETLMWCWGCNREGQTGTGTTASPVVRAEIVPGFPPRATVDAPVVRFEPVISIGRAHACAAVFQHIEIVVPPDVGTVYCWGSNERGQLGRTANSPRSSASAVEAQSFYGATGILVSAGAEFTCALPTNGGAGAPQCWGDNSLRQLGDGGTTSRHTAAAVPGVTDAVEIVAGTSFACVRRAGGGVACWGTNESGQLGDGTTAERTGVVQVSGIGASDPAVQLAAGDEYACARLRSGAVRCWGSNFAGVLGDGTRVSRSAPVAALGITDAVDLGAGGGNTCVVRGDGAVWCWGDASNGALGPGVTGVVPTPARVDVF